LKAEILLWLENMTSLRLLILWGNEVTCTISPSLCKLVSLTRIELSRIFSPEDNGRLEMFLHLRPHWSSSLPWVYISLPLPCLSGTIESLSNVPKLSVCPCAGLHIVPDDGVNWDT
jgi:hypothetical protein